MDHFDLKNGELYAEDVRLADIAAQVGTPVYVYSAATFCRHYNVFVKSVSALDTLVAYSVKANSNLAVLSLLAKQGAGADVVSGGELERAIRAGVSPNKIVFSGVGKSKAEMARALEVGIFQFNVESRSEMDALNEVAVSLDKVAPLAFRINPNVGAGGHEKITTGKAENKFGVDISLAREAYARAATLPGLRVQGVDMHIGSQITDMAPISHAIDRLLTLVNELRTDGHEIKTFDVGGGLGIVYDENTDTPASPQDYGAMITEKLKEQGLKTIFEPGRMIAANAGVLLSEVRYIKTGGARNFLILDAAMNDLIRPALYGAHHEIEAVRASSRAPVTYDVVGPVCETGDTFTKHVNLPEMQESDLVVLRSAGAYGAVQAGQYNTRPLVPEVLVDGDKFAVIRKRPSIDDMLAGEQIPKWV